MAEKCSPARFKSSMSIPLINQDKPCGALCIYADETGILMTRTKSAQRNGRQPGLCHYHPAHSPVAQPDVRKMQLYVEKMRVLMRQAAKCPGAVIEKGTLISRAPKQRSCHGGGYCKGMGLSMNSWRAVCSSKSS
jgi:hypothetical protein